MIKYKVTNEVYQTLHKTQWGYNVTHKRSGHGNLCSPGWLHYYHDPYTASFMYHYHTSIQSPVLWECQANGQHRDDYGMKGGCTELTTVKIIDMPQLSDAQMMQIMLHIVSEEYPSALERQLAKKWLAGELLYRDILEISDKSPFYNSISYRLLGVIHLWQDEYPYKMYIKSHIAGFIQDLSEVCQKSLNLSNHIQKVLSNG